MSQVVRMLESEEYPIPREVWLLILIYKIADFKHFVAVIFLNEIPSVPCNFKTCCKFQL
jgi:hypothetical protein